MSLACKATPTPKRNSLAHPSGKKPVVLSSKRFNGMVGRSCNLSRHEADEVKEEEERYRQYLQDGNQALVKLFQGNMTRTQDDKLNELKQKNTQELQKASLSNKENRNYYGHKRKKIIERAYEILERMKPGPKAFDTAMIASDAYNQQKYYEKLKTEYENNQVRQRYLDRLLCPGGSEQVSLLDRNQVKDEEKRKELMQQFKVELEQDIARRRALKQTEKDDRVIEGIVDREQARCILEREERLARERAKKKRAECERNYCEAIEEKQRRVKREVAWDAIDDRRNCVFKTSEHTLKTEAEHYLKSKKERLKKQLEASALEVHRKQQELDEKHAKRIEAECEEFNLQKEIDEERRNCQIQQSGIERRKAHKEAMQYAKKQAEYERECRRFELGLRFKNEEAFRHNEEVLKRNHDCGQREMRKELKQQSQEFKKRRTEQLYNMGACPDNHYLDDDKFFFDYAAKGVKEAKAAGRPLYPLAKAVERYKKENHIEREVREAQLPIKNRNTSIDRRMPYYVDRAKLKWAEVQRKGQCRALKKNDMDEIVKNCLLIEELALKDRKGDASKAAVPVECKELKVPTARLFDLQNKKIDCNYLDENNELQPIPDMIWKPPQKPLFANY